MGDYVYLVKHAPDPKTLRIDVTLWKLPFALIIYENAIGLDGKAKQSKQRRKRATSEADARRLAEEEAAKRLAGGFEYKGKPPRAVSKPRTVVTAKRPAWFAKIPRAEVARLGAAIETAKLQHRAAEIEALARPAIAFALKASNAPTGVTTRFGGAPDVPAKFAWPMHRGTPLAFLAQYRLDELAKYDVEKRLPARGVISVFALLDDSDDNGEVVRAFYTEDIKRLTRVPPPHDADVDGRPTRVALATPSVVLTLPPSQDVRALHLTDDELDRYTEKLQPMLRRKRAHRLLGWPDAVSPHQKRTTELLAQIDSDNAFGFQAGDVETLRLHVPVGRISLGDLTRVRGSILAD